MKRTSEALIYEVDTAYGHELLGCAGANGKSVALGFPRSYSDTKTTATFNVSLAGRYAATAQGLADSQEGYGQAVVSVFNLKTRRRLLRRDVPGQEGAVFTKLFITGRGHVAWIEGDLAAPSVAGPGGDQPPPIRLMVFASGKLRVAAAGLLDAV